MNLDSNVLVHVKNVRIFWQLCWYQILTLIHQKYFHRIFFPVENNWTALTKKWWECNTCHLEWRLSHLSKCPSSTYLLTKGFPSTLRTERPLKSLRAATSLMSHNLLLARWKILIVLEAMAFANVWTSFNLEMNSKQLHWNYRDFETMKVWNENDPIVRIVFSTFFRQACQVTCRNFELGKIFCWVRHKILIS